MGNPYEGMPDVNPYDVPQMPSGEDLNPGQVDTSTQSTASAAPERVSLDTRKARVQHYKENVKLKTSRRCRKRCCIK